MRRAAVVCVPCRCVITCVMRTLRARKRPMQVVVSVYGVDAWGRDVIKGYGSMHLPTCPGRCVQRSHAAALCLCVPHLAETPCCAARPTSSNPPARTNTRARRYTLRVRLYRPRSASLLQTFLSWVTGMPAEFADHKFPSYGPGREGGWGFGLDWCELAWWRQRRSWEQEQQLGTAARCVLQLDAAAKRLFTVLLLYPETTTCSDARHIQWIGQPLSQHHHKGHAHIWLHRWRQQGPGG